MSEAARINVVELTVSEVSAALKRMVEDNFSYVRVRGEISGYRGPHSSGHVYFAIKDEGARLDAVIWKMTFNRMRFKPEEGLEVVATGKITTYPGKSSYQIVIDSLDVQQGIRLVTSDHPGLIEYLLESIRRLAAADADFVAITANTGHIVFDELVPRSPVPLLSIVEACAQEARGRAMERVLLLGTRFTMTASFYPDVFRRYGITEVRAITRSDRIRASSAISASVMPSAK